MSYPPPPSPSQIAIVNHKGLSPADGGTLRVKNIVSGLVTHGHKVVFAYWSDRGTPVYPTGASATVGVAKPRLRLLRTFGKILYGTRDGEMAVDLLLSNFPRIFTKLRGPLRSSGIVQSEQIWSALFPLLYRRFLNKVCVLDDHNVEVTLAERLSRYVQNRNVYAYWVRYVTALERVCCRLADVVVVTSEQDRQDLVRIHGVPPGKIRVIPNGTDTNRYKPDEDLRSTTRARLGISKEDPVMVFVGRGSYPPNRFALDYIKTTLSPQVWMKHPETKFLLISRDLPQDYFSSTDPRLVHVSDDSDVPYINAADVGLAPLSVGGGTRIKILNYMACGRAIVATPVGCEGIPAQDGRELIVSGLEGLPDAVCNLIENPSLRAELGSNALRLAVRSFSWERSVTDFDRLYENLYAKNGN